MDKSQSNEKNVLKNTKQQQPKNDIGLDPDEQAMNGAYGMAETESEDRANDLDGKYRK